MVMVNQYDIYVVNLDPTQGSEIKKTRPCLIISPDEMNQSLRTVQIVPLTSSPRGYPWRVPIVLTGKQGMVALDQIRTVDKSRLVRRVGRPASGTIEKTKAVLREMLVS